MLAKQAFVEEVKSVATVSQELIEITLEGFGTNKPKPGGAEGRLTRVDLLRHCRVAHAGWCVLNG